MRYNLLGLLLGLICSFGQPPFNYNISCLGAIALFFYFLKQLNNVKNILWFSFSFGYGYYFYSHHWLTESLKQYGDSLMWLLPFGLLLIPAFFALYTMLTGYLIAKYAKDNIFSMAIIWVLVEFVRSYSFIESPWLLIGYIWSDSDIISQTVALSGIWGLSLLTILLAAAIYAMLESCAFANNLSLILISFLCYFCCYGYGYYRLQHPPLLTEQAAKVRVIQANIEQNVDHRIKNSSSNLLEHMRLSKDADLENINYIIWPESAHEYPMNDALLDFVKQVIPDKAFLIMNAVRIEQDTNRYFNSLFVIDHNGKIISFYDKIHLVALGEYIPFRSFLPFIDKITPGAVDFSKGSSLKIIDTPEPFLPSICYEDSFPGNAKGFFTWIVNVTNDGWFGSSIGPYQHLAIAKFRAIEQGVPMVRVAITGVSAAIDSFGRITKYLPLLTKGTIDIKLPSYISSFTYYNRWGNFTLGVMLLIIYLFNQVFNKIRLQSK